MRHFVELCEYALQWRWESQQMCLQAVSVQCVGWHCWDYRLAVTFNSRSLHLSFLVAPSSLQWKQHHFLTGWAVVMCGERWGPWGLWFAKHKLPWFCVACWSVRSLLTVLSCSLVSHWHSLGCCVHYWKWGVVVSLLWQSSFSPQSCPFLIHNSGGVRCIMLIIVWFPWWMETLLDM